MDETPVEAFKEELGRDPGPFVIDVRSAAEYEAEHVRGATLFPLHTLDANGVVAVRDAAGGRPVRVLCRGGTRAAAAAAKLNAAGLEGLAATPVAGGTLACVAAGLPVVRGRKAVSLERQVRIAAGSLVAAGTALGWFVHPVGFVLPAFVGCGLVFSGLTDTCGMGRVLAAMPWNARRAGGASGGVAA